MDWNVLSTRKRASGTSSSAMALGSVLTIDFVITSRLLGARLRT